MTARSSDGDAQAADMIRPLTLDECDEQLDKTRERYLAAERRLDFDTAFNLWTDLQRLLEYRIHLPQQRTSPENGGAACSDTSSDSASKGPVSS